MSKRQKLECKLGTDFEASKVICCSDCKEIVTSKRLRSCQNHHLICSKCFTSAYHIEPDDDDNEVESFLCNSCHLYDQVIYIDDGPLYDVINALRFKCVNRGCKVESNRIEFKKHKLECKNGGLDCPIRYTHCDWTMTDHTTLAEVESHLLSHHGQTTRTITVRYPISVIKIDEPSNAVLAIDGKDPGYHYFILGGGVLCCIKTTCVSGKVKNLRYSSRCILLRGVDNLRYILTSFNSIASGLARRATVASLKEFCSMPVGIPTHGAEKFTIKFEPTKVVTNKQHLQEMKIKYEANQSAS